MYVYTYVCMYVCIYTYIWKKSCTPPSRALFEAVELIAQLELATLEADSISYTTVTRPFFRDGDGKSHEKLNDDQDYK